MHSKFASNGRGGIGKGALNQLANLRAILSHVASLLEVTEEVLADAVFTNASTLFSFLGSKLVDCS
jgi:Tat protein secretion system quality control protein TatD with DNase activity